GCTRASGRSSSAPQTGPTWWRSGRSVASRSPVARGAVTRPYRPPPQTAPVGLFGLWTLVSFRIIGVAWPTDARTDTPSTRWRRHPRFRSSGERDTIERDLAVSLLSIRGGAVELRPLGPVE